MKRGSISVGKHVLEALLQLPMDWRIVAAEYSQGRDMLDLIVEGDGLPECPEGVFPMGVKPICLVGQDYTGLVAARNEWPRVESADSVLVPVKPSEEMVEAADGCIPNKVDSAVESFATARDVWAAMVAARPK